MRSVTIFISCVLFACFALVFPLDSTPAPTKVKTGGEQVTGCDAEAYLNDPDPKGTNVRSGPGAVHKVIGHIPNKNEEGLGVGVHITGSQGKWVRIDRAVEEGGDEEKVFFKGEGWLYAPLLAGSGVGGGSKLYSEPDEKSSVIGKISNDDQVKLHGCRGKWVLIEHKKMKGWMAPRTFCPSSLTTCS